MPESHPPSSYLSQFHHQITGNAQSDKKLVFLHGLMGFGANWRRISRDFSDEYHILYYDQRGHGRSIAPPTGYGPENFAQDLHQIIGELGWDEIYLVGHSMGGRAAAQFAFSYPECTARLVIEDIGPEINRGAIARIEELLDRIPAQFANKLAAKDYFMNQFVKDFAHRPQAKLLGQFLYTNFETKPSGEVAWKFNVENMRECVRKGRELDRSEMFAQIQVPTLLLRGVDSEELSKEIYQKTLASNLHFTGVEIEGAGHWVHYDQAERFVEEVKRFFGED